MRFVVKSVSPDNFNAWIDQARGSGSALDDAGYTELAKPSKAVPPTTYHSVDPKLFERIIEKTVTAPSSASGGGIERGGRHAPLRAAGG